MDESSKSKKIWSELEWSVLRGKGIDIGCGKDPITTDVRRFDMDDGDANEASKYLNGEQFDFVYASHCLEHMYDPRKTLHDWWSLVKPGGHLFFMVPDEDLYEQGVFPSRFNSDHKATFTLFKNQSWSPVSFNVQELAHSLADGEIIKLELQDKGYNHSLMHSGPKTSHRYAERLSNIYAKFRRHGGMSVSFVEKLLSNYTTIDQTRYPDVLAQIACIVKKHPYLSTK